MSGVQAAVYAEVAHSGEVGAMLLAIASDTVILAKFTLNLQTPIIFLKCTGHIGGDDLRLAWLIVCHDQPRLADLIPDAFAIAGKHHLSEKIKAEARFNDRFMAGVDTE